LIRLKNHAVPDQTSDLIATSWRPASPVCSAGKNLKIENLEEKASTLWRNKLVSPGSIIPTRSANLPTINPSLTLEFLTE
jgi:hypothetical protein